MARNPLTWVIPILMFSGLFYILRKVMEGGTLLPRGREAAQISTDVEHPFGLRVLMWLSLLSGISAILGLVSFNHPLFLSKYALPETHTHRLASFLFGVSFLPLFWGIRRRLAIAWKFGWVLLVMSFALPLAASLESLSKQPDSGGWIAYAAVTIGFSVVAIYWGRWWYRQKRYFSHAGF